MVVMVENAIDNDSDGGDMVMTVVMMVFMIAKWMVETIMFVIIIILMRK